MEGYHCNKCNHFTLTKSHMNVHLKTVNHCKLTNDNEINAISKKFKCDKCPRILDNKYSLARHKESRCKSTKSSNNVSKTKKLEVELAECKQQLHKYVDGMQNMATKVVDNSTSVVELTKLLVTKFQDTPNIWVPDNICDKLDNNPDSALEIIFHYENKKLARYIGKMIVKEYRKSNHTQQPMWTTDAARLNFMIKCVDKTSKKESSMWTRYANGVKIAKIIIADIMKKVKVILQLFIKTCNEINLEKFKFNGKRKSYDKFDSESDDSDGDDTNNNTYKKLYSKRQDERTRLMHTALELIKETHLDKVSNKVLKYIAPYFDIMGINRLEQLLSDSSASYESSSNGESSESEYETPKKIKKVKKPLKSTKSKKNTDYKSESSSDEDSESEHKLKKNSKIRFIKSKEDK